MLISASLQNITRKKHNTANSAKRVMMLVPSLLPHHRLSYTPKGHFSNHVFSTDFSFLLSPRKLLVQDFKKISAAAPQAGESTMSS